MNPDQHSNNELAAGSAALDPMENSSSKAAFAPNAAVLARRGAMADLSLNQQIWRLALPATSENLLQTSLMIVDTLMIARYGSVPLAASAVAGVVIWRSQMTLGCIEKGTMALVARSTGEANWEKLGKSVAQSIVLASLIGLFLMIVGIILAPWLLVKMAAEPNVVAVGTPFCRVIFAASIPRLFFFVASASLRGTGDTRTPMWITLGMNFTNVIFNFPLIYGVPAIAALHFHGWAGLGLTGSGISTALSLLFAAVTVLWVMLSGNSLIHLRLRHFKPDPGLLKTLLRISIPSFAEELLISIGFLIFFRFIAVLGTAALAAHAISTRIESLSFMAGVGFAIATATLVGQSLGMGDPARARKAFSTSTKYCVLLMSTVAIVLSLLARHIVNLFSPENEQVAETAHVLLVIAAIEQPLLGFCMTLGGGLRGAGDTVTPMITSLLCNIIVRVSASYYFAFTLGWGVYGVYLGTMVDWIVRSTLLYLAYRSERWARIRL
jgi:putative MATE family efflux protein